MIKILQSIFTEIQPGIIPKFRFYWTLQTYSTVWKNYRREIFWMATHHEISSAKSKVRTKILVKKLNGLIKSIDTHKLLKFLWKYFDSYKSWLFRGIYIRAKYCRRLSIYQSVLSYIISRWKHRIRRDFSLLTPV